MSNAYPATFRGRYPAAACADRQETESAHRSDGAAAHHPAIRPAPAPDVHGPWPRPVAARAATPSAWSPAAAIGADGAGRCATPRRHRDAARPAAAPCRPVACSASPPWRCRHRSRSATAGAADAHARLTTVGDGHRTAGRVAAHVPASRRDAPAPPSRPAAECRAPRTAPNRPAVAAPRSTPAHRATATTRGKAGPTRRRAAPRAHRIRALQARARPGYDGCISWLHGSPNAAPRLPGPAGPAPAATVRWRTPSEGTRWPGSRRTKSWKPWQRCAASSYSSS